MNKCRGNGAQWTLQKQAVNNLPVPMWADATYRRQCGRMQAVINTCTSRAATHTRKGDNSSNFTHATDDSSHSVIIIIIIYPFTARVVGAPQMSSQPVSSIFPCSPLPSGIWRITGPSIPCCCLPTSSLSALSFSPFHCVLQDGFGQT